MEFSSSDDSDNLQDSSSSGDDVDLQGNTKSRKRKRVEIKKVKRKPIIPKIKDKEVISLLEQANAQYISQEYAEAIVLLEAVIKKAPGYVQPYQTLGLIYQALGDKPRAYEFSLFAAKLMKFDPLWIHVAEWAEELGDYENAPMCWMKSLKTTEKPQEIQRIGIKLVFALARQNCYRHALRCTEDLINKSAKPSEELRQLQAVCYQSLGDSARAIKILEELVNEGSEDLVVDFNSLNMLTSLYLNERDILKCDRVCDHFLGNQALSSLPSFLIQKRALARIRLNRPGDQSKAAIGVLQERGNLVLLLEVLDALLTMGFLEDAWKTIQVLEHTKEEPLNFDSLSPDWTHYFLLQTSTASAKWDTVPRHQTNHALSFKKLKARYFHESSEDKKAIDLYRQVVAEDESDSSSRISLAYLLLRNNYQEEAEKIMRTLTYDKVLSLQFRPHPISHAARMNCLERCQDLLNQSDLTDNPQKRKMFVALYLHVVRDVELDYERIHAEVVRMRGTLPAESSSKNSRLRGIFKKEVQANLNLQPIDVQIGIENYVNFVISGAHIWMLDEDHDVVMIMLDKIVHRYLLRRAVGTTRVPKSPEAQLAIRLLAGLVTEIAMHSEHFQLGSRCLRRLLNPYAGVSQTEFDHYLCFYARFIFRDSFVRIKPCMGENRAWLLRRLRQVPKSFALTLMAGHFAAMGGRNVYAIAEYSRAFALNDEYSLTPLCLASAYIGLAISRITGARNECVIRGFAVLQEYQARRLKEAHNWAACLAAEGFPNEWIIQLFQAETEYNHGRMFQQLSLINYAGRRYDQAIGLCREADLGVNLPHDVELQGFFKSAQVMQSNLIRWSSYNLYRLTGRGNYLDNILL